MTPAPTGPPGKRTAWYSSDPALEAATLEQRATQAPSSPARKPHGNTKSDDGLTYLIGATGQGVVKVGRTTTSARTRMAAMQTGSPVPLVLLCTLPHPRWEDVLHHHYASTRQQGEWFTLELADLAAIMRWACQAAGITSDWPSDRDAHAAGWDATSTAVEGVFGAKALRSWLES